MKPEEKPTTTYRAKTVLQNSFKDNEIQAIRLSRLFEKIDEPIEILEDKGFDF